ncbi:MAG: hypothetical protein COW65_05905 [Cytophagales bacterium CG18_big_fil_WC_8_21_14_2_50_42_9]|nr:MAG: hypothetical protein COW65_05905 [Cytophagales bacterium CG18_big_fil_WC_8_21_14_2_50_42_9]
MIPENLYIGTSGWSYRWKGLFYPEDMPSAEYLPFYSQHFNCTEVNSSFYHFTMPKTIEKWLTQTPPTFKFSAKLNQEITHKRKFEDVAEPLDKFMSRYLLMGNRLGPLLIQIAGSFRYERPVAEGFYRTLREKYPDTKFVLEVRHTSWHSEESLDLLRDYNISFVIASAGKRFPYLEATTNNLAYLRLHGDERLYSSLYSEEKLERYAFMINDWLLDGKEVWVFFNNTMFGSAIQNAKTLQEMVQNL